MIHVVSCLTMCVRTQIDIELNLVKNILSSYKAQSGMAGPASNIYGVCVCVCVCARARASTCHAFTHMFLHTHTRTHTQACSV